MQIDEQFRVFSFLCKWVHGNLGTTSGRLGSFKCQKLEGSIWISPDVPAEDKAENELPFNFLMFYLGFFFL